MTVDERFHGRINEGGLSDSKESILELNRTRYLNAETTGPFALCILGLMGNWPVPRFASHERFTVAA